MPLTTEHLKVLGLNNIDDIENIMGPDSNLIKIIQKYGDINTLKSNDYFEFNKLKFQYDIIKYMKIFDDYFNHEIDIIFNNNISYYDILLNIFFLTLVVVVIVIMYWDSVYRNARKNSRCVVIDDIINENKTSSSPYIYNIYIVDNNYLNTFYENYLIKLTYDFTKNTTIGISDISKQYNTAYKLENGNNQFKYYKLELNGNTYINDINNTKLNDINYIIADDKNRIINTEHANNLKDFVKAFSKDQTTNLRPIYDIKHAYAKNISSDY